ncbi:hypothetical protein KDL29_05480 [bacterium]|nr:hypothetical protein [bacterium]
MGTRIIIALLLACLASGGQALAQESGSEAGLPYSIETSWQETKVGDASVTLAMHLELEPWDVYEKFVGETSNWWSKGFTMGGESCLNMQLEAYASGRLLEIDENGESLWANVIQVVPGSFLGLSVPEGSFWSGAGSINISFNPGAEGGTDLLLEHRSFQQYDAEIDGAEGYAFGWTKLVAENFRMYCEGEVIEDAIVPLEVMPMDSE